MRFLELNSVNFDFNFEEKNGVNKNNFNRENNWFERFRRDKAGRGRSRTHATLKFQKDSKLHAALHPSRKIKQFENEADLR